MAKHLSMQELENGLDYIRKTPKSEGKIEMIVRRPVENQREILEEGELSLAEGLVGDIWKTKGSSRTPDGSSHPEMQLNIMNSRVIELIAQEKENWPMAGDQFFIDLDLSEENLPAGTRLQLGDAIVEVTPIPHNGCKKFVERYGLDAMKFVNSPTGKSLHLRGINAKVVKSGKVKTGSFARKIAVEETA